MASCLDQVWLVCVLGVFSLTRVGADKSRPNVLFLVVDDLRPELGCYGKHHMATPNIDQLASKSVLFEQAFVQQAVCSPSRTSFLTGRRPDTTHVFDLKTYFRVVGGNYTTLPQHFKENGYITQSVGKIFHPGRASNNSDDYPYSWTYRAYHAPTQKLMSKKICPTAGGNLQHNAVCPVDLKTVIGGSLPDIQNTDYSIEFLKNRSADGKPFFLGMGYHKPHLPFAFPKKYLDLYPLSKVHYAPNPYYPAWMPEVAWSPWDEIRKYDDVAALNISYPFGSVPLDYQLKLRQSYYAAASYTDAQVGRVLSALDKLGLASNTVITFHGDHGWQLGDHGEWCKHTNFDMATKIPMMVHVPGVTASRSPRGESFPFRDVLDTSLKFQPQGAESSRPPIQTDAFAEAVDLYATISELAGIKVPPLCPPKSTHIPFCTEGTSLVPVIKNLTANINKDLTKTFSQSYSSVKTKLAWKEAIFSQYPRPGVYPGHDSVNPVLEDIRIMGYTMRTALHRYTEWVAYNHTTFMADWTKVFARELYVYSSDPLEDVNVADVAAFQDLTRTLSVKLRAGWRHAMPTVN